MRSSFDKLISWTKHPDNGVKYFSGTATYKKSVNIDANLLGGPFDEPESAPALVTVSSKPPDFTLPL
jgi:hypothetical protein